MKARKVSRVEHVNELEHYLYFYNTYTHGTDHGRDDGYPELGVKLLDEEEALEKYVNGEAIYRFAKVKDFDTEEIKLYLKLQGKYGNNRR